jgi:putative ABC transport system permease protein
VRTLDLLAFGLSALRRQKVRAALTLLGVVIGTATLVISISVGEGVKAAIDEQFRNDDRLRQISVFPSNDGMEDSSENVPDSVLHVEGTMSDAKRERIRKFKIARYKRENAITSPKPLTRERVEQIRQIPHVVDAIPELDEFGRCFLEGEPGSTPAHIYSVSQGHAHYEHRLEVGGRFSSSHAKECIVHEFFLYQLGIRDDADVRAIIGKKVRIEVTTLRRSPMTLLALFDADLSNLSREEVDIIEETFQNLPEYMEALPLPEEKKKILLGALRRKKPGVKTSPDTKIIDEFTVVGVVRAPIKEDPPDEGFLDGSIREADVIMPRHAAETFFMQLPKRGEIGFNRVRVIVDHEDNLKEVDEKIKKMGLHEFSLGLYIHQIKRNVMLVGFAMDFIALVALIVAGLGITNTMFTTVLERTREIGIMKAVGAKDRQILTMFLIEGSLIGLIGGIGGVIIGWLASFPGNRYALRIMDEQGHKPLPETVFAYPIWLLISVPLFAMLVTTLAAVLPARRAARVEPVIALRHE